MKTERRKSQHRVHLDESEAMKRIHEGMKPISDTGLAQLCCKCFGDEESTTSAVLTLASNPWLTMDEMWEDHLDEWFDRQDEVVISVDVPREGVSESRACLADKVVDLADACVRGHGFVGIRLNVGSDGKVQFNAWLHHSFAVVRCVDSRTADQVECVVDAVAGHRPPSVCHVWDWRRALRDLLVSDAPPGPSRARAWQRALRIEGSLPLLDASTSTVTRVSVVM